METRHFTNIQALRGVAVLLVVGRHLQVYADRVTGHSRLLGALTLGDAGVDLFFVISGFVLAISTRAHLPTWRAAGVFLSHRAGRIYPLFWLYMIPTLWVYGFHREWLHRPDKDDPVSVIRSLLLWPQKPMPMLGQSWSLTYELYFYLVLAGLFLLPRRHCVKALLLWALGVLAVNSWTGFGPGDVARPPEWNVVCNPLGLEFITGALVGVAVQRSWLIRPPSVMGWLSIGAAVVWTGVVLLPLGGTLGSTTGDGWRTLGYGLPALALVYGAVALELNGVKFMPVLVRVGTYSYSIYLSHILVLNAVARVWPRGWTRGVAGEGTVELLMLGAILGTGAVSYHLVERPLLVASRRWQTPGGAAAKAADSKATLVVVAAAGPEPGMSSAPR